MQGIKTKSVLKFALLPEIRPRANRLFGSGFGFFSMLMAQIYSMAGLLPKNHPYLNPDNKGRYGVHHVIAEAANNLVLSRKNLDKIFIFIALLAGAVLLVAQFAIMFSMLIMNSAFAGPIPIANLFDTLNPQTDIAFNLLVLVFGVPNVFCSSSAPGTCADAQAGVVPPFTAGPVPYPIHSGLQDLFEFYSFGILLIGVLIFLYHIVVIVAETAVTGSPFGQRFQNVWVPIRLVVALGLLVPINFGLNSGQFITLYAAKLGSSIATNGWLRYNNTILAHPMFGGAGTGANPIGERETLIAIPKRMAIGEVVEAMSLVHTCAYSYWADQLPFGPPANHPRSYAGGHYYYNATLPTTGTPPAPDVTNNRIRIRAFFVKTEPNTYPSPGDQTVMEVGTGTTLTQALDFYGDGNIIIRFGEYLGVNGHPDTGGVKPYCGDIVIPVTDVINRATPAMGGSARMQQTYFDLVKDLWFQGAPHSQDLMRAAVFFYENANRRAGRAVRTCAAPALGAAGSGLPTNATVGSGSVRHCEVGFPDKVWMEAAVAAVNATVDPLLIQAWRDYIPNSNLEIDATILNRGWAGAGMWFNRLADINGSFQTAVNAIPEIRAYPLTMEETRKQIIEHNAGTVGVELFSPNMADGGTVDLDGQDQDIARAKALYINYKKLNEDGTAGGNLDREAVYNIFMDAMNMILGTDGVFDLRGANVATHPLVQLIMVGKGMVESTIRNLGVATASSFLGGIATAAKNTSGAAVMEAVSSFFFSTAFLGLTAGIVLFYVIPFLPFVYFFFAVGTWVKSIFEAMVGVPLWALAHLRLDGDGLPGDSASNGYFLIFEIGIRPILTVFGLIAAIIIFASQVRVLHFIWDIVVENSAGYNNNPEVVLDVAYHDPAAPTGRSAMKRDVVDQFFFTIIYTIVVYMLATASFKLIDMIPDNILRWGGIGVSSFGDQQDDALQGLQRYVAMGGMVQGQQLAGGVREAAGGIGRAGGTALGLGGRTGPLVG